jgi:triosephosphate isomerase
MRQPLVAGNWKMNGSRDAARTLLGGILNDVATLKRTEVAVCPPFILIPLAADQLASSPVKWGGQSLDVHKSGAYTGEIAGSMLKDYGCTYAIVGHSERRALFGESDELVAAKFKAAQEAGLVPILCVGETLEEREANRTESVVARQLDAVLSVAGIQALASAVIAYEPVWAIGTGRNATPQQAQDVHKFIRGRLAQHDKQVAAGVRILYGGSVKAANAQTLFAQEDIDGGLIGGASLDAQEFLAICRAAE